MLRGLWNKGFSFYLPNNAQFTGKVGWHLLLRADVRVGVVTQQRSNTAVFTQKIQVD